MLIRELGGKTTPPVAGDPKAAPNAKATPADGWRARLGSVAEVGSSAARAVSGWVAGDAEAFVTKLAPFASKVAQQLGVSVRAVLAQAALETQWGKHMPTHADGSSSNNLFGMKAGASWDGGRINVPTLEFQDGVAVRKQAQFRAYESPAQSFEDYGQLVSGNPRYAQALGKGDDVAGFARGLISGGYATDPSYAAKITSIANSPAMRQALQALKNLVTAPMNP
jgi:flagellar protein FlgJ